MISCNCTAAHKAILENNADKLKSIICSGTDLSKECSCTKQISTLMHAAVYAGQSDIIELLSKNGVDKDATNAKGHTPLELAFMLKNYDAAVQLVILGCDPNKHHYLRRTPLSIAVSISHFKLVELLLLNKAEALPQEKVLYMAIDKGESKIVHMLAKYFKSTINAIDDTGSIPLIYSVLNGSVEICKALLLAGCNVNATDKKKRTALIYAAQEGRSDHVQILVDHKADTSCVFNRRQKLTPLHVATIKGHIEVIRVLKPFKVHYDINRQTAFDLALKDNTLKLKKKHAILEAFVEFDFIHKIQGDALVLLAAKIGHVDVLNILLKRDFNPNARDPSDKTPLYIATEKGRFKIIEALFNFGPAHSYSGSHDLQTKNTALHVAIAKKQDDKIIDLLLSNMAKEDMNKKSMESLLFLAIKIGNVRFIQKLLKKVDWYSGELDENPSDYNDIVEADKKYNINTRDSERKTPLFKATEIGHIQIVQALVECGIRIRSARRYCRYSTALHVAIFKNHDENMISLLCEYAEEELNNQNDAGKTPLMIAIEGENVPAVKVLMKNNADINIGDYFGNSPFSVVEKMKNIELWGILLGINDRKALVNLAITKNMDNFLKILVQEGVAIDDEHVVTALNMHKDNKYLELLLSNNVHIQQNSKPLSIAFSQNNDRAVELLIASGANCKYAYDTGNLYLIEAVKKDKHKIVEILLNSGCNPNWICNLSELEITPLKLAIESLNISMVELLLKKGAEPSPADLTIAIRLPSPKHKITLTESWQHKLRVI